MIWKTVNLGDIADVSAGNSAPQDKFLFEGGTHPFVRTSDVGKIKIGTLSDSNDKLNEKGITKLKLYRRGTILFPKSGASTLLNHRVILDIDAYVSSHLATIKSKLEVVSDKYLWYFLQTIDAAELVADSAYPSLNIKTIQSISVALPPLAEQERIVAKLDAAFAEIDQAIEIARNKQKNAQQLFKNYLANIFQINDQKWVSNNLKNITSKIGSGATPRGGKASYKTEGISLIRSMNVHDMYFKYKDLAKIDDEQASALSNVTVQENDVLFNITGASVARCCLVEKDVLPARVNQHVSIIRVDTGKVLPKFIVYGLISKSYKDQLLSVGNSGGATRQAITKTQIQDFLFHYPKSKEEQNTIIDKLDSIYSYTKNLEEISIRQIHQNMQLKSAILSEELMPNKEFAA